MKTVASYPQTSPRARQTPGLVYGPDHADTSIYDGTDDTVCREVVHQVIAIDLIGDAEWPDKYWDEGWTVERGIAKRQNFDYYGDRVYKAFPTRYRLADFRLTKSLRRNLDRNRDLATVIRPLRITPGKEELHYRHALDRFGHDPTPLSRRYPSIVYSGTDLHELCVFHPEHGLIAMSVAEMGQRSSHSDLCAWLPGHEKRGLGTFTLLKEVEHSRSLGFDYHYIDHAFLASPGFNYKLRFPAAEVYDFEANIWRGLEDDRAQEMLRQELPVRRWHAEKKDWID